MSSRRHHKSLALPGGTSTLQQMEKPIVQRTEREKHPNRCEICQCVIRLLSLNRTPIIDWCVVCIEDQKSNTIKTHPYKTLDHILGFIDYCTLNEMELISKSKMVTRTMLNTIQEDLCFQ